MWGNDRIIVQGMIELARFFLGRCARCGGKLEEHINGHEYCNNCGEKY